MKTQSMLFFNALEMTWHWGFGDWVRPSEQIVMLGSIVGHSWLVVTIEQFGSTCRNLEANQF